MKSGLLKLCNLNTVLMLVILTSNLLLCKTEREFFPD